MPSAQTISRKNKLSYLKRILNAGLDLCLIEAIYRDKIDARRFKEVAEKIEQMLTEAESSKKASKISIPLSS